MMKKITFRCRIITPLFMGGANQEAELRTQSFNGLFRYWFRLLGGSFEDEKRLFGWGGEGARKGLVYVFCERKNLNKKLFEKVFDSRGNVINNRGINYIGFSLDARFKKNQHDKPRREYLQEGQNFNLTIRFHPTATDEDIKKFLSALWCAFYLGNFGSRSRRGFGSITIEKIEEIEEIKGYIPEGFDVKFEPSSDICNWLNEQLEKIKNLNYWQGRTDIPWIFENMEIYKVNKDKVQKNRRNPKFLINRWALNSINSINDLHDFMGFLMAAYRSYYQPDYQTAKDIIQGKKQQNQIIEKSIFGLPLNFYFSSLVNPKTGKKGMSAMVEASLGNQKLRRASPLIFKIISDGQNYEGFIIVFKPSDRHKFKFLPDGARLSLMGVNLQEPDWSAIDKFIESLKNHGLITKCYPFQEVENERVSHN